MCKSLLIEGLREVFYSDPARIGMTWEVAKSVLAGRYGSTLITCYLRYVLDPYKVADFEAYARMWIPLVTRMGGAHHGYFLPHEGANNIAVALFSFPSLAAHEAYRQRLNTDEECQAAFAFAETTRCILSYERSFMRPVLETEAHTHRNLSVNQ